MSKRTSKCARRKSERRDLMGDRRSPHKYRDSRPVRGPAYFPPINDSGDVTRGSDQPTQGWVKEWYR